MSDMSKHPIHEDIDDDEVLRLIHEGATDEQHLALDVIYWRWATPIKHFFLNRGCPPKDCEDLLQEVIIKIWRGASSFRQRGQASSWIWTITRNTLNDHYRQEARRPLTSSLDPEDVRHEGHAPAPYDHDRDDCIAQGIARFSEAYPDRADALEMWSAGIDHQMIASYLGRSYGATRQFLLECRKKMRPFLDPCLDTSSKG